MRSAGAEYFDITTPAWTPPQHIQLRNICYFTNICYSTIWFQDIKVVVSRVPSHPQRQLLCPNMFVCSSGLSSSNMRQDMHFVNDERFVGRCRGYIGRSVGLLRSCVYLEKVACVYLYKEV